MAFDRIRLLKFLNLFAIGGTERQFVNIVKRLDPERFDLHIGCFRKQGDFLKDVEACGRPLTAFNVRRLASYKTLRTQFQFARYLRKHRIQVLHTYGWYANVFGIPAARLAGVPVTIASVRDTGAYLTRPQIMLQREVCRFATCLLANSDAVRDWLASSGCPSEKIRVIRNGITVSTQTTEAQPRMDFRQELGLPPQSPLIGAICRLSPVKAVNDLIQAAAMALKEHPSARFVIIGDGEERAALTAQAQGLGIGHSVYFTGLRTDVSQIIPQLTVSVLPSLSEGLSNTLLESMAAGVPVVATRVGGNVEIVADEVTGLLVQPRHPEDLKAAICRLLSNPQQGLSMGAAGKERIRHHFSMESAVRETESLYRDLLSCSIAA